VKRSVGILIITVMLLSILAGCGQKNGQVTTSEKAPAKKTITVTDLKGRQVEVKCPPERVIALQTSNGVLTEIIKASGVEKTVVGVNDKTKVETKWPPYVLAVPSVGETNTPDLEKIISLKPDLIIAWDFKPEVLTKFEQAGIPVILGYGMGAKKLLPSITSLGQIFNQEKRANELLGYMEKQYQAVNERVKGLSPGQKPKVYLEGPGEWMTYGKDREETRLIEKAGGTSIIKENTSGHPVINSEWVLKENPDVIIKFVWKSDQIGFDVSNTASLKAIYEEICSRPGLKDTKAVKNNQVYIMGNFMTTPRNAAGIWYLARWLHPDLFKDINPEAIHREMLKKFCNEELRGTWVYPGK